MRNTLSPNFFLLLLILSFAFSLFCHSSASQSSSSATQVEYKLTSIEKTSFGLEGRLEKKDNTTTVYGNDIQVLKLKVFYLSSRTLRIKITDEKEERWQVPGVALVSENGRRVSDVLADQEDRRGRRRGGRERRERRGEEDQQYDLQVASDPFSFSIKRIIDGEVLFNTSGYRFVFEDRYLELSTSIGAAPSSPSPSSYIYGIGERINRFRLNNTAVSPSPLTYTLFARDQGTPTEDGKPPGKNLYASHPFYLEMRPPTSTRRSDNDGDQRGSGGRAHGVFLLNSNAMDVSLTPSTLTYHVVGGVFDFFFFTGPTADHVLQQYHSIIGLPSLPPYWGLGWHQCKWGYTNVQETMQVVKNYSANGIPLDVMWNDIDWMNNYENFVFDPVNYAPAQMQSFLNQLHQKNMHYVMITDAGVALRSGYIGYEKGLQQNVFTKEAKNPSTPLVGKVWPGAAVFPDWFHPNSSSYWLEMMTYLHTTGAPYDGVWLDMNEASNFCDGECNNTDPDISTPYTPGGVALNTKTIRMDALHYNTTEYNAHNMNGYLESRATNEMLKKVRGKRPFIISRSTFPGHGRYAGHWLGDNSATWNDLAFSISGILNFQMFGIPLVGADICGFNGDTNEELCTRWMQLGNFYPFARNHHTINSRSQEPYAFGPTLLNASIIAINLRYTVLPLYYTLFSQVSRFGGAVVRPLMFEFPDDVNTYDIDSQFLVGADLMVSPVLSSGQRYVNVYFPSGPRWFDFYSGKEVSVGGKGGYVMVDAPILSIPLHIKGGRIIPLQTPQGSMTALDSRTKPYQLVVSLNQLQSASAYGRLYVDDGDDLDSLDSRKYLEVDFLLNSNSNTFKLTSNVLNSGYQTSAYANELRVLGLNQSPRAVNVNGQSTSSFKWDDDAKVLTIFDQKLIFSNTFTITWK